MASDNPIISIDPRKTVSVFINEPFGYLKFRNMCKFLLIRKIRLLLYSVWIVVRLINTTAFNGKSLRIAIVMRFTVHSL